MAELTEKILLELRLNADQLKNELGAVRLRTKELRENTAAVNKDLATLASVGAKGTKEYKDLLTQLGENERQLVGLNRQAQELNKNLDAVESAKDSYNELAASTAFLEKQLKAASVGANISAEGYDILQKKVNAGNQALRDFSRNQSNNNRELVGSYAESLGPAIEGVTGKIAGATNSVSALEVEFKALKAQRDVLDPTTKEAQILEQQMVAVVASLKTAQANLKAVEQPAQAAAGSLAAMEAELEKLEETRRFAAPEDVKKLNGDILSLKTGILEARGVIDEFGDRIEKNAKKEDIATLGDAFGGVAASINVATILLGDNENATKAAAAATKALVVAQSLRQIQIGIASAADAKDIIVTGIKNVLLRASSKAEAEVAVATTEHAVAAVAEAVAVEASAGANLEAAAAAEVLATAQGAAAVATEATAAATTTSAAASVAQGAATEVATDAAKAGAEALVEQAVATEGATVAQKALNFVMKLSPIGLVVAGILLLVGLFTAYSSASDKTKTKVNQLAEAFLRYSNPLGLIYTGLEQLYKKSEAVRTALDPLLNTFNRVFSAIGAGATKLGQSIGLIDTAAEAAIKAKAKLAEAAADRVGLYQAEAKLLEQNGAQLAEYRQKERDGIAASLAAERAKLAAMQQLLEERVAAGDELNEKEAKDFAELSTKVKQIAGTLGDFDKATTEGLLSNSRARLAAVGSSIDAQLELTRSGSAKELALNKQKLALEYEASITVYQQTAEQRKAIDDKYNADLVALDRDFAQSRRAMALQNQSTLIAARLETVKLGGKAELDLERAALKNTRDQALNNWQLSASQRAAINAKYRADELVLETNFARQVALADLAGQQSSVNARLALGTFSNAEEYALRKKSIELQEQLELGALDKRRDNTEKEKEIRANASAALRTLDAQNLEAADAAAQRSADSTRDAFAAALGLMSAGLDEGQKKQLEASAGFANTKRAVILASARAELLAINNAAAEQTLAAGNNAEQLLAIERDAAEKRKLLETQTSAALLTLEQETNEKRKQLTVDRVEAVGALTSQALGDLSTIVDAQAAGEADRRNARMNEELASVGNNVAQQQVIRDKYAKMQARDEAEAAEKRRKIQIAQALVNAGLAITQILAAPAAPFVEPFASIVRGVQIGLVVATTATQIANMKAQKFAEGGVVRGPSHAAGGIQLYHRSGAHVGEMEGDETILVPGVAKSPILRRLASTLNVLAGGRAFAGGVASTSTSVAQLRTFAAGGVVTFDPSLASGRSGGSQLGAPLIDYVELAAHLGPVFTEAVAALPPSNVVFTEFKEAERVATYTEKEASN